MARLIEMPKLSDTMEEGGIAQWLKKEGEPIEEGEALVEIETDKATMEYASPEEGFLLKILVPAGKTATLNAAIAVVGEKDEIFDLAKLKSPSAKTPIAPKATEQSPSAASSAHAAAATHASRATTPPTAGNTTAGASAHVDSATKRLKASPLAKKQAESLGIDLQRVEGSGPGGRIVSKDLEGKAHAPNRGESAATSSQMSQGSSLQDKRVELSMMRKTIAKRLTQAKNEAPHFYLRRSVDMSNALSWRERANLLNSKQKISVNDLFLFAASRALRLHPEVNASFAGDAIELHGAIHVALAVALPGGLVTPVLRHADQLGLSAVALQAKQLILAATEGKLTNADYLGGTFTISNLGMFGIEEFTAIINPPQAAILAVGATRAVPAVKADGSIGVQQQCRLTLSCDHRVVDGAVGAKFLETLCRYLEDPVMMLVD
jgi:pyruvate dehydrogenase E2 component (dihydrolipoamide acetyltransferase)